MIVEEKIFGPLTFKQFLFAGPAAFVSWYLFTHADIQIAIVVTILLVGILIAIIKNTPTFVLDEEFLKRSKATAKTPEEFERSMRKMIANLESQIVMRKERGLAEDPKLMSTLQMLKDFQAK